MAIDIINSLKFGDNTHVFSLPYGTCSTIPTAAAKTVSVDNFSLETGARVTVKFNYSNTVASPTLNVNNTGAKAIKYRQSDIPTETIEAGRIYEFIYDGTNYELIGDIDTNTTYPSAGSSLGLVKTGGDVTITNGLIVVNDDSHAHVISNIDGLSDALNKKASLGSDGRVPSSQLPSYVDDVIEGTDFSEEGYENEHGEIIISGETGKIYVDTISNKTYRWSGSKFVEISASLALGTTSSTAYRGDRGNTAYQHSQTTSGNPHKVTKADLSLGNVENKSSATIRGELTKSNVTTALGYTPPTSDTNTTYDFAASKSSTNNNVQLKLTAGGSGSGTDSVTVKGTGITSVTTDANGVVTIDSTLPVATSTALGGVKSGTDITVDSSGNVSVNDNSHAHTIANISGLQNALNLANEVIEGTGFENGSDTYFWGDEIRLGGDAGKIYIDTDSNKLYRWSSSDSFFIETSVSLALGETSSTAYRGDRGKIAYNHSQATHAPTNAEKNQNAFSNVKIGSTTIAADTTTDTLELVAGSNITLTPDATNDKITIASTHPTITKSSDSTSTAFPEHGLTFSAVDSIDRDGNGHVTKINTKTVTLPDAGLHFIGEDEFTVVAGSSTSNAYLAARWSVPNVDNITTPTDGMSIAIRTPAAGYSGGIVLSINGGTTFYPLTRNVNTLVTSTYASGSTLILTFNSTQKASPYLTAGTATEVTGCWQIADYDSNTTYTNVKLGHGYCTCSTAAATAAKTASLSNYTLTTGGIVAVRFTNGITVASPTLNINSKGAKSIYYNGAALTDTSLIKAGDVVTFIYSSQYHIIAINRDTTYTPASLGTGYGTCSTAAATTAKAVTLSNYSLVTGGVVSVKFTNSVPASATMNINSKGAKPIYYNGKAIVDGIICAGEIATFMYDGTNYHLLTIDRTRYNTTLVPFGKAIPENADLNTVEYLKVGNYYCSSNATTKTLLNCPTVTTAADGTKTGVAFMMTVSSPLSQTIDDETGTWKYRYRTIQAYNGPSYTQYCYSDGTAGHWIYGPWYKNIRSCDTVDTATKLATGKTIALSGGATGTATSFDGSSNITIPVTALDASKLTGTVSASNLPAASGTAAGITLVYPAASCTTFSSDSGTVTPLAVQKGAKMFAITRPSSSTTNAIARYSNTTGDVKDSKITIEDVTNTKDTSKKAQVIAIPAEGNKKMVYGYCTDQVDGTSFIGGIFDASATEYPYAAGLAIGGTSGNLLWKGSKVLVAGDAATKVGSNMVIKLNSGTTEGTNLFTYNGSAAKTVNITPSSIGALPTSGGTLTGTLTAKANNTGTTAMVRNIAYGTSSSLASLASTANNGTILIYTS